MIKFTVSGVPVGQTTDQAQKSPSAQELASVAAEVLTDHAVAKQAALVKRHVQEMHANPSLTKNTGFVQNVQNDILDLSKLEAKATNKLFQSAVAADGNDTSVTQEVLRNVDNLLTNRGQPGQDPIVWLDTSRLYASHLLVPAVPANPPSSPVRGRGLKADPNASPQAALPTQATRPYKIAQWVAYGVGAACIAAGAIVAAPAIFGALGAGAAVLGVESGLAAAAATTAEAGAVAAESAGLLGEAGAAAGTLAPAVTAAEAAAAEGTLSSEGLVAGITDGGGGISGVDLPGRFAVEAAEAGATPAEAEAAQAAATKILGKAKEVGKQAYNSTAKVVMRLTTGVKKDLVKRAKQIVAFTEHKNGVAGAQLTALGGGILGLGLGAGGRADAIKANNIAKAASTDTHNQLAELVRLAQEKGK